MTNCQFTNDAKQAILNHIDKAIGEELEIETKVKQYPPRIRNQLRAEIRKELGL